ncbi:DsbA family protein [Streptomyces sp. BI20]|uniref:DsbA family protein n=1 Tax=Streptomyces sp. BI20 TaxID=3403460 RepID=UPI003C75DCBC
MWRDRELRSNSRVVRLLETVRQNKNRIVVILVAGTLVYGAAAIVGLKVREKTARQVVYPSNSSGGAEGRLALREQPAVPVTVTLYVDLSGEHSTGFLEKHRSSLERLLKTGQVQIDYRFVHDRAESRDGSLARDLAAAAACADDHGGLSPFLAAVVERRKDSGSGGEDVVRGVARGAGLDSREMNSCIAANSYRNWVSASQEEFEGKVPSGAPSLDVNGLLLSRSETASLTGEQLIRKVKEALAASGATL